MDNAITAKTPPFRRAAAACLAAGLMLGLASPATLAADTPPADSHWRLANIATLESIDPTITDLVVDAQGNLSGLAGCNTYRRSLGADGYQETVLTRKACSDLKMKQEAAFLEVLRHTTDWQRDGRRLLLKGPDGRNLAVMLEPITRSYHFDCGGQTIAFDVLRRGQIRLTHGDQTVLMHKTTSASGSRYENGGGNVIFWGKGQQGTFEVDGDKRDCRQVPDPNGQVVD
ncbi:META domain-containing protein [Guyparkeria sp. 1SP6A2]|nr:META domain-containing protein [Guyparkeria sp. 1SP6A2]